MLMQENEKCRQNITALFEETGEFGIVRKTFYFYLHIFQRYYPNMYLLIQTNLIKMKKVRKMKTKSGWKKH